MPPPQGQVDPHLTFPGPVDIAYWLDFFCPTNARLDEPVSHLRLRIHSQPVKFRTVRTGNCPLVHLAGRWLSDRLNRPETRASVHCLVHMNEPFAPRRMRCGSWQEALATKRQESESGSCSPTPAVFVQVLSGPSLLSKRRSKDLVHLSMFAVTSCTTWRSSSASRPRA